MHAHVLEYKQENKHTIEDALMHFKYIGESHFNPDHGHEHLGEHHLVQKKKTEDEQLRWPLPLFKNGEIVQGEGPQVGVDSATVKTMDHLDQFTDEELLMMAGDGVFGGYVPPKK